MDVSPLATESFSYSWLSNVRPGLDGLDGQVRASLEVTSKEFDEEVINAKRESKQAQDFDFEIPTSPTLPVAHAEDLFSDGVIKPVVVDTSRMQLSNASNNNPPMPVSPSSSGTATRVDQDNYHFLRRWIKPSERMLRKCFGYLKPFCRAIEDARKRAGDADIDKRMSGVRRRSKSTLAPPQRSTVYSTGHCSEMESAISEAILHCKRSIEI